MFTVTAIVLSALPSKVVEPVASPLRAIVLAVASLVALIADVAEVAVVALAAVVAVVAVAALPVISPGSLPLASLTGTVLAVASVEAL